MTGGGAARYAAARAELAAATEVAKAAVRDEHAAGATEVDLARRYGVTRMTVRAWLGKGRSN